MFNPCIVVVKIKFIKGLVKQILTIVTVSPTNSDRTGELYEQRERYGGGLERERVCEREKESQILENERKLYGSIGTPCAIKSERERERERAGMSTVHHRHYLFLNRI